MSKIISKPATKEYEESWDRIFRKGFDCEFRPCSLTAPYGKDYIHTMCHENCFIRKEYLERNNNK